ncbi:hypothetical protein RYX45_15850 [Alkalihalophilus pseudofirmus]|uniref:Uncharacterized protein n=1 Tax=Alkalihalophilus pseudofirmus TaxID=79885 RepID=A0AAJ2U3U7_ALKPS|nr:hypothetical protein [Alkalihalophilus pseudofirmus]MDV2886666.1 hypothetical protein [Alkalihalophilus pseudofirmus]WEG17398.1 hypothetical protein PQ478_02515 [Alkalihalophilus pseudofirmus]
MLAEIITFIDNLLLMLIASHFGFGLGIMFVGKLLVDYYEWGIFDPPETKFQKATNIFMRSIVGLCPYLYNRYKKYNWLVAKLLYIVSYLLLGILALILYQILSGLLNLLV